MDEENKKSTKGGRRVGSGRKKLDATLISFRLDNELLDTLNKSVQNRTDYINKAVRLLLKKDNLL